MSYMNFNKHSSDGLIRTTERIIHISHTNLDNLKDNLNAKRDNLQTILNTIKSIDEKLCQSLVGKTKTALEQKTKDIEEELNKKIEALTGIISNVDISNKVSLEVDTDIANQMGVKV